MIYVLHARERREGTTSHDDMLSVAVSVLVIICNEQKKNLSITR